MDQVFLETFAQLEASCEGSCAAAIVDCDTAFCIQLESFRVPEHTVPLLTSSEATAVAVILRDSARLIADSARRANGSHADFSDGGGRHDRFSDDDGSEQSFDTFSFGGSSRGNWRPSVSIDLLIETDRRSIAAALRPSPKQLQLETQRRQDRTENGKASATRGLQNLIIPATIVSRPAHS
jgi:hypothetical protein